MIIMAEHAGFCFGVKRAVDAIEKALQENSEVWTIGLPIHNPQEVSRLEAMGLRVANDDSEIPAGAKVLIRAHGEPLEVFERLKSKGIEIEDMTCPFVGKAQRMAAEMSNRNYYVIVLGDKNHPEVKGIVGHISEPKNSEVIANEQEAENVKRHSKIGVISQTTQREEKLSKIAGILTGKASELHICNTICKATSERQDSVRKLVNENNIDGIVLIGGKQSANTAKLRDIIISEGKEILWVEDEKEIESNSDWFNNKSRIGIAAGASTPEWLIINIKNIIAQKSKSRGYPSNGSTGSY